MGAVMASGVEPGIGSAIAGVCGVDVIDRPSQANKVPSASAGSSRGMVFLTVGVVRRRMVSGSGVVGVVGLMVSPGKVAGKVLIWMWSPVI